jgi:hypothetical protein
MCSTRIRPNHGVTDLNRNSLGREREVLENNRIGRSPSNERPCHRHEDKRHSEHHSAKNSLDNHNSHNTYFALRVILTFFQFRESQSTNYDE